MLLGDAEAKSWRMTADGYLVADARVARAGIQIYKAKELGLKGDRLVRAYRPEAEVFAADSLKSFAHKPVTIEHPSGGVDADTWGEKAVGHTGAEILRDGEFVRIPLMISDSKAIAEVQNGRRELSMGYSADIVDEAGAAPDGQPYDVILRNLRMNHIAIVQTARGGDKLRIGDDSNNLGASPFTREDRNMTTRSVVIGDAAITLPVADADIIENFKRSMTKRLQDAEAEKEKLEEELEDEKKKYAEVEDSIMTPEKLQKAVADRLALRDAATALVPNFVIDGLSDADVRKKIVAKHLGDAAVQDASSAEISGMFRALTLRTHDDGMRHAVQDSRGAGFDGGWDRAAKLAGVRMKKEA